MPTINIEELNKFMEAMFPDYEACEDDGELVLYTGVHWNPETKTYEPIYEQNEEEK